jgi:hypothetical protein
LFPSVCLFLSCAVLGSCASFQVSLVPSALSFLAQVYSKIPLVSLKVTSHQPLSSSPFPMPMHLPLPHHHPSYSMPPRAIQAKQAAHPSSPLRSSILHSSRSPGTSYRSLSSLSARAPAPAGTFVMRAGISRRLPPALPACRQH